MKLHTETKEVLRGGVGSEKEFSIKATSKAFSILSSGLYSDKILAIVRELSCNAYDAHVAAGRRDAAIEVKLPTTLDPTFYVKDYGIGLDHEGVTNLYTTYFESSKSDSNDFIGALGLGSKSPFSYVSSFSVEARHNGKKRLYSAFINEHGVPSITMLGEEKTTEENGLMVSLAVKTGDSEKFKEATRRAFMYFDVQPKVTGGGTGFKPYDLKHTVTGTGWKLRETEYYARMEGAYVVQGLVAYPIDRDILRQHGLSNIGMMILGQNIDLFVKIGDVEVAASREALSYTKKTIENLVAIVDTAAKEVRKSIQIDFDKQASLWDARILHSAYSAYSHKMHNLYDNLVRSAKPFTYKGATIDDNVRLDLTKIKSTALSVVYMSHYQRTNKVKTSGSWDPSNVTKAFEFQVRPDMRIVVDDAHGGNPIMSQYLAEIKSNPSIKDNVYVLIIKGLSKNSYNQSEVDSILKALGVASATYSSRFSYVVAKTKYTYRARKSDEAVTWDGFSQNGGWRKNQLRRVFSRLCWTGAKVDLHKETGFYVPLERFSIVHDGKEQLMFDGFLKAMVELGIFPSEPTVYGLNEKQVYIIKKNKRWSNIFMYCEEKFAEMNDKNALLNRYVGVSIMSTIGSGVKQYLVKDWNLVEPKLVDGKFKTLFSTLYDHYTISVGKGKSAAEIENAANHLSTGPAFLKKCKNETFVFTDLFEATMNKHAMLKLVDWSKVSGKDVQMIVDYVNFVAKA